MKEAYQNNCLYHKVLCYMPYLVSQEMLKVMNTCYDVTLENSMPTGIVIAWNIAWNNYNE